ncbi:hypothetical protein AU210_002008 [Fusarium oxysporum f. sp. radicis-cucumerinum]|uniref:Uncharacterized protein n=3 Tax=Fusarium oxysporum TaxID=5507 RepID=A0A2H3HWL4_FUSOX|nr:hypothetical protein FOZG_02310 [Fusarium oxysporum Fo47]PCD46607.1 hypothetical protein AU210_002008 [Fusarium oxysporum f. sp. radicis-cucumerinum]RKK28611.1 hypothetical protein BFJ65_g553 [Fusarium oxysporum f. sp. cepae]RKK34788.1 hypothetical protein BFJ67_g13606 [Fusarium oxysporum f. sp. cepae]RKK36447.1 hypothetical protein BFJ66_g13478 [Fusarium oxysporum f. sp. cepae]
MPEPIQTSNGRLPISLTTADPFPAMHWTKTLNYTQTVAANTVTTVAYITVNPNNPANVITTQIPVTLPYTPCHCDHQIHPTVDMTTIGAPCRACGPNGEHSVTLTMPTAACEGGSEGFGDSYRPPYSPHRVEDHKILSDVRPYLKPQSTMAQQGEPSPMKGYVAVNGIRFMKDPMSSQPLVTDQRFTHPTHLPSITS